MHEHGTDRVRREIEGGRPLRDVDTEIREIAGEDVVRLGGENDARLRERVGKLRRHATGRLVDRPAVEPLQRDCVLGVIGARADVDQRHAAEQAAAGAECIGRRTGIAQAIAVERDAADVRDLNRGTRIGRERRHLDEFDVAFLGAVESVATTVGVGPATRVHEVNEWNAIGGREVRIRWDRARLVD